jgi:NAD-dependent DNA ligase
MTHTKLDKQYVAEISKLRTYCLIHRYLYYVKASPLVDDLTYDAHERKLKELVTQYPQLAFEADNQSYCPTNTVGSDNPEDYPRRIEQLAESLLKYKGDYGKPDAPDVPVLPSPSIS